MCAIMMARADFISDLLDERYPLSATAHANLLSEFKSEEGLRAMLGWDQIDAHSVTNTNINDLIGAALTLLASSGLLQVIADRLAMTFVFREMLKRIPTNVNAQRRRLK